jgi:hypothetical protein
MVGQPTIEKGVSKAINGTARIVKRDLDASSDQVASELQEALKA